MEERLEVGGRLRPSGGRNGRKKQRNNQPTWHPAGQTREKAAKWFQKARSGVWFGSSMFPHSLPPTH